MSQEAISLAKDKLVGPFGIIRDIRQIRWEPRQPRLWSASCVMASVGNSIENEVEGATGAVGLTWEEAEIGAIGEGIERYCGAFQHEERILFKSAAEAELAGKVITMEDVELYSEQEMQHPEFPFKIPARDEVTTWVTGTGMLDDEKYYVPASMVYIPYVPYDKEKKSDFLGLAVSSGQACHTDKNLATLSGLCEVIERDAFMLTWMRRLEAPRVNYMADPFMKEVWDGYFEGCDAEFHMFDITRDVNVPTMLCIGQSKTEKGRFSCVGAATRPNARDAAYKALIEAAQGMVWCRDLIRTKPDWKPEERYANIRDFEDHVRLYCEPEMEQHLDFLMKTEHEVTLADYDENLAVPENGIKHCISELKKADLNPIYIDLTSPDIEEFGFHICKVFIPGTAQLCAVHGLPGLGSHRYNTVPEKLGFTEPHHKTFNRIPHPFP